LTKVYLGLGSNLGDREENLRAALELLAQKMKLRNMSSVYETEPVGFANQPRFLNLVCEVETRMTPESLLRYAKDIELKLGRKANFRNGPREIDIDILLYGKRVINTPQLQVPHPRMAERAFVLVPLAEIAPAAVHPVTGATVTELAERTGESGVKRLGKMVVSSRTEENPDGRKGTGDRMYTISVERDFDAAHYLREYGGKCENLHGHRFRVIVSVSGTRLNKIGIVFDFTELKKLLDPVLAKLDHKCLNEVAPFDKINPSSENLARTIYDWLKPNLPDKGVKLSSVEVWESPQSRAVYTP
jgi:2-amino-4-hydroxy-6-hydroxymethyldihydropteridine diphosphokinase/queuosine biosynthesis protein QueD